MENPGCFPKSAKSPCLICRICRCLRHFSLAPPKRCNCVWPVNSAEQDSSGVPNLSSGWVENSWGFSKLGSIRFPFGGGKATSHGTIPIRNTHSPGGLRYGESRPLEAPKTSIEDTQNRVYFQCAAGTPNHRIGYGNPPSVRSLPSFCGQMWSLPCSAQEPAHTISMFTMFTRGPAWTTPPMTWMFPRSCLRRLELRGFASMPHVFVSELRDSQI